METEETIKQAIKKREQEILELCIEEAERIIRDKKTGHLKNKSYPLDRVSSIFAKIQGKIGIRDLGMLREELDNRGIEWRKLR